MHRENVKKDSEGVRIKNYRSEFRWTLKEENKLTADHIDALLKLIDEILVEK